MKRGGEIRVLEGLGVSRGVAIGRAVTVADPGDHVLRFHLDENQIDPEIQRFELARRSAIGELEKAQHKMGESLGEETAGILEAQALLLADPTFVGRVIEIIVQRQVNAEWAVLRTTEEYERRFAEVESGYLRERGEDLRNVANYLLRGLAGIAHHELSEIQGDVVIIGRELTPSDAVRFARGNVVGFALEAGGETTHTTIIVRGLNLPTVVKLDGLLELATDRDPVIVDGEQGKLILHPTPEVLARYQARRDRLERNETALVESGTLQPRTADGVEVALWANLELLEEVEDARRFGAGGVGLYRSEFFFIEKSPAIPTEEEHYELFSGLLEAMAPQPVTVRTFDLGGRKLSRELFPEEDEENPVLGLRGIRLTRIRPEIMRTQLRALFRAAVKGDLRIMVPLVTTVDEVRDFKLLCDLLVGELEREGLDHCKRVPLGAMIEVPAAALIADHMARELDFLSIGTNDLIQYALAVDRNNEHVSDLYQSTHPAVLRLLQRIVEGVRGTNCELSICGEMASDPLLTPFLVGIGLRRLSMSPRSIPIVKERVRSLRYDRLEETASRCLELGTAEEVGAFLESSHPIEVGRLTPAVWRPGRRPRRGGRHPQGIWRDDIFKCHHAISILHDSIIAAATGRRYNRGRGEPEMQRLPAQLVLCASLAALTAAFGCASTAPSEVDLPPQTLTEAPTSTAEEETALVASERPVPAEPEEDAVPTEAIGHGESEPAKKEPELAGRKHTIVIQSGTTTDVTPQSLQQASASERERRAATDAPVVVITNRNLAEMAEGGQVSVISAPGDGTAAAAAPGGGEKGAATTPAANAAAASPSNTASKAAGPGAGTVSPELAEEYWRGQALKIRLDWKAAVEEVDELQSEVADLRRRFYEEDDPFYRDNEIKPSWDRALDRLQEAKADAETQERKLTRFLEEGRRSGALPGWLREGVEFEPQATGDHSPSERRRSDDPWEPKVLEEEPRDP